ncbi:MAG TPA: putative glycolipid-binding domain-containing protein [Methylomirabilota bacterium]|nr:putative glycolipid-binding domain-containing protein [Methylomirabilota bacterium]
MSRTLEARWQDWAGTGLQHLVLREAADEIVADAAVVGDEEGVRFGARFRIACDAGWRVRRVEVEAVGGPAIVLTADGAGHWRDGAGAPRPELDGAIDVDLPMTPFTNTLPIRRLNLRAGESADLRMVYIVMPQGGVTISPQRYTCLEARRRYRYQSLDSDFVAEVEVDADGLVVTYPGLFRRV